MDFSKMQQERSQANTLSSKDDGKKATVAGWVYDIRDLGKVRFIVLRDMSGELQITAHKEKSDKKVFEEMGKVSRESAVIVSGIIKKSDKATGGRELVPSSFDIVGA